MRNFKLKKNIIEYKKSNKTNTESDYSLANPKKCSCPEVFRKKYRQGKKLKNTLRSAWSE